MNINTNKLFTSLLRLISVPTAFVIGLIGITSPPFGPLHSFIGAYLAWKYVNLNRNNKLVKFNRLSNKL